MARKHSYISTPPHLFLMSSSSWLQALLHFSTAATTAARRQLYKEVAAAHLTGRPGFKVHPESLPILREMRWSLLHRGTAREKAATLELVLRLFSEASETLRYDESQPTRRMPVRSGSSQNRNYSNGDGSGRGCGEASEMEQLLLLEQVQCLVEAKVAEIPLTARHFRYPLRSPHLATVSLELPLLLLDELAISREKIPRELQEPPLQGRSDAGRSDTPAAALQPEDYDAQRDCCIGLVEAGHVDAALQLCVDGAMFEDVIQQISRLRRDGWRRAWQFAAAVPHAILLSNSPTGVAAAASATPWLRGVLAAAQLRFRASEDVDGEVLNWVAALRRTAMDGASPSLTPEVHRLLLNTYLAVCPVRRWPEALQTVLDLKGSGNHYANNTCRDAAAVGGGGDTAAAPEVAMGRLMHLLRLAKQPWITLLLFYGDAAAVAIASTGEAAAVQEVVVRIVAQARAAGALHVGRGILLTEQDLQHPAVYNHAMAALTATQHHSEALSFYHNLPLRLVNWHTHWTVLQMTLQDTATAAAALTPASYQSCVHALVRLTRPTTSTDTVAAMETPHQRQRHSRQSGQSSSSGVPRMTKEQGSLLETLALWACQRGDEQTVATCAANGLPSCRYLPLIAIIAAAQAGKETNLQRHLHAICIAPSVTIKQLCLATALVIHLSPTSSLPLDEVVEALSQQVGHTQSFMDDVLRHLVDYSRSLQRRLREPHASGNAAPCDMNFLAKDQLLPSVMDLTCGLWTGERAPDASAETAAWLRLLQIIKAVGAQQHLSVAKAAPALVSAGVSAEVAIELLPS